MHYVGLLYRALNPVYAREPMSGEGARRYGGRFNPRGMPALYTSQSVMTAIREANQIGTLQPTTLVAYEAEIGPIFDATDPAALDAEGITAGQLAADDWRLKMLAEGKAPTQRLAERLKTAGYAGMQVRSYAKGATEHDMNLVLWVWGAELPTRLRLVDDEGRLG
ncbi:RES domain-containing protein [Paracoccus bogoriensis]|uniref:RES family NAD+ phosphorylase n=1 Tax=Paracoccus bogoriensis TaxID=242065 RepID=UPI001CA503F3|nr:RES domain-containing protein [Paracoccus bogoriensis]MBW7057530.1 RES domain-containing protein [Paracoccus bogoriensis]